MDGSHRQGKITGKTALVFVTPLFMVALFYGTILFSHPFSGGINDWTDFEVQAASARYTIAGHGQFPLWDIYQCGGKPALANPEKPFFSPFFLLVLLFGVPLGLKLTLFVHVIIGYAGMYLWLRRKTDDEFLSAAGAAVFMVNGHIVAHFSAGHLGWNAYAYLPWCFFLYEEIFAGKRYARYALFAAYLLLFSLGSPNFNIFIALASVLWYLPQYSRGWKTWLGTGALCLTAATVAAMFLAPSFLPSVSYLREHSRVLVENDSLGLATWLSMFSTPLGMYPSRIFGTWFNHEYFFYLGPIFLVFIFFSLKGWRAFPRDRGLILLAAAGLLLSLGNFGEWSPYNLLRSLPFLQNMRVPSRFALFTFVPLLILVFQGLTAWRGLYGRWSFPRKYLLFSVAVPLAFLLSQGSSYHYFKGSFKPGKDLRALDALEVEKPFRQAMAPRIDLRNEALRSYQGVINCISNLPLERGTLYRAPLIPTKHARLLSWSPNRITFAAREVNLRGGNGGIVVNMNCDSSRWTVENGRVECLDGHFVVFPAVLSEPVSLTYRSPPFETGIRILFAGMALLALLLYGDFFLTRSRS